MTTDCTDCAEARLRTWCGYRIGCNGCSARAVARSLAAFNALDTMGDGDAEPLRALIVQLLPEMPYADARRLVWDWWRSDHPQQQEKA